MQSDEASCCAKIATDLVDLGIRKGDTLLVHASFKSLGPVPGGIETLVCGFLDAIGSEGTLLMPALSWSLRPPEIFDLIETPTNTGAIPEFFRKRPGTLRSLHPTHSVCGVGRLAHDFLAGHETDPTPCGRHSPFFRIMELGGTIIMLGCGLKPNTTMHAIEELVEPPPFLGESLDFDMRDSEGRMVRKTYRIHAFHPRYRQCYERVGELEEGRLVRPGHVLAATAQAIDAVSLRRAALAKMKENPYCFVERVDSA